MGIEQSYISVTDLQRNSKKCLSDINEIWKKMILSNNKPYAMIISLKEYSKLYSLSEAVEPDEIETRAIKKYEKKKREWKLELVDAFEFLNSLN